MRMTRKTRILFGGLLAVVAGLLVPGAVGAALDRPPEEGEVDYSPADSAVVRVNPPPFVWLPAEGAEGYVLQYSRSPDFRDAATVTVEDLPLTVHVPGAPMEPGGWYWRYGYRDEGQGRFGRARHFTIAEDAVELPFPAIREVMAKIPRDRPRMYFTAGTVEEMRAEPQGRYKEFIEPVVRAAEAVLARGEEIFPEPKPREDYEELRREYQRIFVSMRPYTQGMVDCAQAYLFTGDRRFGEEAKRRLMHFMTWDVDGPSSVIWPSELGMDIAERAPRTFDWIHDLLDEDERALVLNVLKKRMQQIHDLHRSMPFESRPFSSHPGRMIGFVVEGSLVLAHDVPEAQEWLEYTLRLLWSVFPAWGGEDGGWHEGIGYWGGYIRRIFNVVVELDRIGVPLKEKPFFRNTPWFGFYVGYPNRQHRAFGDGYEGRVTRGMGQTLYIFSTLYQNPYFRWHAEQLGAGPTGPTAVEVYDPDLEAKAPEDIPQSRLFSDVGLVAMHSDMARPAENVFFLLQSSTFGSISHNHANQNAFVVEAFGEALAISSGYYQSYSTPHHSQWVWQTKAHNSLLVDGEGQTPRSRSASGSIVAYEENGDWVYAAGDATPAYEGRLGKFIRHVVFVRPGYFVMIDELESAGEPSTFQWLLHARNEMDLSEEAKRVTISEGQVRLQVDFLEPEGLKFEQRTGWDPLPDRPETAPPQFHFTASTQEPQRSARIVSVLSPHRAGTTGALPSARLVESEGGIAIQVGDDLVLWKEAGAAEVRAAGQVSRARVAVYRGR
jgi:hypothetical protein